jgi:C4-dicarboxylate-specific signal transduction histidine kinase
VLVNRQGNERQLNSVQKYIALPEHAQCRILVFNDSAVDGVGVVGLLESMGYAAVTVVTESSRVLPTLRTGKPYDAAFVDLHVPHRDGLIGIHLIRESFSAAELPILAIGDAVAPELCNAALLAGANDYLVRPIGSMDVAVRLRNLLKIRDIYTSSQDIKNNLERTVEARTAGLKLLIENGLLMSRTHDRSTLIRHTLFEGRRLLHCDAATLYLVTADKALRFSTRTRDDILPETEIPLYDPVTGQPNVHHVSTWSALKKQSVRIDNVYEETGFDLSGTRGFDAASGYKTVSVLTVPMIARDGDVFGVLQFINKLDPETDAIVPFSRSAVPLVEALAAQATVTLENLALNDAQLAHLETNLRLRNKIAQLDRQRSLGSLSASLGHELNQPLAAILTNAQVARKGLQEGRVDAAQVVNFLDKIVRNIQRASAIVERIQQYIRPSTPLLEPVDLHQVALEMMDLVGDEARRCGASFVSPPHQEVVQVLGDAIQLSQIILNVFCNALEALEHAPKREIRVALGRTGSRTILQIRDTGPGLSPEALAQAGAPHFTTKQTGLGLGLSISRSIAEQFNGTLSIVNAPDGGAVVELNLPALTTPDIHAP